MKNNQDNQHLYTHRDFLEKTLEREYKKYRQLISNRGNADDLAIGNIKIAIDLCEKEIKRLKVERNETIIEIEDSEKNETNSTLIVYILASTDERIKTTIPPRQYKAIQKWGYKPKSKEDYAPFKKHPPITTILEELKIRYGYKFGIKYLDNNLLDEDYFHLVHSLPNSVLIADICSFCPDNKRIASVFNTNQHGGTIITTPCVIKDEMEEFLKIQVEVIFRYGTIARKKIPLSTFFPHVKERYEFERNFNWLYGQLRPTQKSKTTTNKTNPNNDML